MYFLDISIDLKYCWVFLYLKKERLVFFWNIDFCYIELNML